MLIFWALFRIYKMEDQNLHCGHIMLFHTSKKAEMRLRRAIKFVLCTVQYIGNFIGLKFVIEIDTDEIKVQVDENPKNMT